MFIQQNMKKDKIRMYICDKMGILWLWDSHLGQAKVIRNFPKKGFCPAKTVLWPLFWFVTWFSEIQNFWTMDQLCFIAFYVMYPSYTLQLPSFLRAYKYYKIQLCKLPVLRRIQPRFRFVNDEIHFTRWWS